MNRDHSQARYRQTLSRRGRRGKDMRPSTGTLPTNSILMSPVRNPDMAKSADWPWPRKRGAGNPGASKYAVAHAQMNYRRPVTSSGSSYGRGISLRDSSRPHTTATAVGRHLESGGSRHRPYNLREDDSMQSAFHDGNMGHHASEGLERLQFQKRSLVILIK